MEAVLGLGRQDMQQAKGRSVNTRHQMMIDENESCKRGV